jgi:hypothetical protein
LRRHRLILALAFGLATGLWEQPASAQRRGQPFYPRIRLIADQGKGAKPAAPRNNLVNPKVNPGGPKAQQPNLRGLAGLPPKWVENLQDMSPEEQERFMRNNQQFQSLAPQRQAQIRNNVQNWNRLSPVQRDAIRDREALLEKLTPQQRVYIRNVLLPEWQQMPQDRKQLINGRLRVLQGMNPEQRQAALDDSRFMQGLSPSEQSVLRDLNSMRNPGSP